MTNNTFVVRTISSIFMLIIFLLMIFSNNFFFLILTQIILFLTNWELLRLIEFKKQVKTKIKNSNFLLSRCQISKYDFILIFLINLTVLFFYFSYEKLQIICLILILINFLTLSDKNFVKISSLLYTSSAFIFLNSLSLDSNFIKFITFIVLFSMTVDVSAYLVGKTIGGPKLLQIVSPNKTLAGFIGGIIIPLFFALFFFLKMIIFQI